MPASSPLQAWLDESNDGEYEYSLRRHQTSPVFQPLTIPFYPSLVSQCSDATGSITYFLSLADLRGKCHP